MSAEDAEPPQYIVTAPGEENNDDDDDVSSTTTSTSTGTTINTGKSASSSGSAVNVGKTKAHNTRSHSLQSSSTSSTATFLDQSPLSNALLMQQLKAHSSMNIVTEKHVQKFSSTSSSSQTTSTGVKGKFTSFLQHPDSTATSHGATFLTAQQKHVRQFVRSTSAHSSTDGAGGGIAISGKEKCIRSTSQQIDDGYDHNLTVEQTKGFHQSAAILISKSAETIEGLKSYSASGSMRTQLTLSGGLLAPPNRKLTILSPIHAPPGLHDLLKKHRSPLSPRISFPGTDAELFP